MKVCGSVPHLSNYANIFLKFYVCCDISEKKRLILFIVGRVINHNRDLKHVNHALVLCQNVAFMSNVSYILYVCNDISKMNHLLLFMLGIMINHHRGFMHIKYTWALCQK